MTGASPVVKERPRILVPLFVLGAILGSLGLGIALIAATSAGRSFVEGVVDGLTGSDDTDTAQREPAEDSSDPDDDQNADNPGDSGTIGSGQEEVPEGSGVAEGSAFNVVEVIDFDPLGDNVERPRRVGFVLDADPGTSWVSESYDNRAMGNLKAGVGLVFVLDDEATVRGLEVNSPTQGWSGQVFAAQAPYGDLNQWGDSLDERTNVQGNTSFDLRGVRANAVLLWITDLGDAPPRVRIEITDITLS
jgi:hypothetical protein